MAWLPMITEWLVHESISLPSFQAASEPITTLLAPTIPEVKPPAALYPIATEAYDTPSGSLAISVLNTPPLPIATTVLSLAGCIIGSLLPLAFD